MIALQNIWKLFTPVIIYFVLKYSEYWYNILAFLDIIFFTIAVIFVFKFIENGEVIKYNIKIEDDLCL